MIRVLQVLGNLERGGAETFVMNLYRKLDRSKCQFDFVVHSDKKTDYYNEIQSLGGNIFIFPKPSLSSMNTLMSQWNLFLREHEEYQIIHSHVRSYASLIASVGKKNNRKVIAHSHSISNGTGISAVIKKVLQFPLRYKADYFFACTDEAGKWLFGRNINNNSNYYIIRNGIDVEVFNFDEKVRALYRNKLGIHDEYVFINVASFRKVKNQIFLIGLFTELKRRNKKIKLLLVGSGDELSNVKKEATKNNLEQDVIFLGERGDIAELLQASDCFLFPSLWEGLGISAIEAQATGLKTVCSDKIPCDVKVTDLCTFSSLDMNSWLGNISTMDYCRYGRAQQIIDSGYDINDIVNWQTNFYLKIGCES